MAFSIPTNIQAIYSQPPPTPVNAQLQVGISIKDEPKGTETTMKKANQVAIDRVKEQDAANVIQYDKDLEIATQKADIAGSMIERIKTKKNRCITIFAIYTIAAIGLLIASIVTNTWPLFFMATLAMSSSCPFGYFAIGFSNDVDKLQKDIDAPGKLPKPSLQLPVYNPDSDKDLAETRSKVQNKLATMNIQELAESDESDENIIAYALLDRVKPLTQDQRPPFYAKTIQLRNTYNKVVDEHEGYVRKVSSEFNKLQKELHDWKSAENSNIASQEWNLRENERIQAEYDAARRRGQVVPVRPTGFIMNTFNRWDLDSHRTNVAVTFGRREAENQLWYQNTMKAIDENFAVAMHNIETQYATLKA